MFLLYNFKMPIGILGCTEGSMLYLNAAIYLLMYAFPSINYEMVYKWAQNVQDEQV